MEGIVGYNTNDVSRQFEVKADEQKRLYVAQTSGQIYGRIDVTLFCRVCHVSMKTLLEPQSVPDHAEPPREKLKHIRMYVSHLAAVAAVEHSHTQALLAC